MLGLPAVLLVGSLAAPKAFWDDFLFRYFWGPMVADSQDATTKGISPGYNWVNTLFYGIGVVLSLFGIHELIGHYDIDVDEAFVLSLIPWILLGGSLRTLEDVGLFSEDISLLFISPLIYFLLGISAILGMLLGSGFRSLEDGRKKRFVRALILSPPLLFLLLFRPDLMWYLMPLVLAVMALFYIVGEGYGERYGLKGERFVLGAWGTSFFTMSFAYNIHFIFSRNGANPMEGVIIPLLALGTTAALLGAVRGWDLVYNKMRG